MGSSRRLCAATVVLPNGERLLTFIKLHIMCTHIFIVILTASSCFCYAGYELFQGFYVTDVEDLSDTTTQIIINSTFNNNSDNSQATEPQKNYTTLLHRDKNTSATLNIKSKLDWPLNENLAIKDQDIIETTSSIPIHMNCPEDEKPTNIGSYEVPTQRDFVLFTRNVLLDMFNSFNQQTFYLLKDIRAATKATSSIEKKCQGNKIAYRQCVKHVSNQCQQITKSLVKELEKQKQEIAELTKGTICNLSEMKTDPITILRSLAQKKVSLDFALPGFLRLLSACSLNCDQSALENNYNKSKPWRHMTDQELVVKHFLTRKNYLDLIMDSRHKSTANSN